MRGGPSDDSAQPHRSPRPPQVLVGRPPLEREEFLGTYFDAGPLRDTARELWDFLETDLGIDPRGLHPDDEVSRLLEVDDSDDSLRVAEAVMAIENLFRHAGLDPDSGEPLGTVRETVRRLANRRVRRE